MAVPAATRTSAPFRVVGLLGGIASGKSTVASLFEALGAERIDADSLAHVALEVPAVRERVRAEFGAEVFGPDGRVDRVRLGKRVFADGDRLRVLEEIVHPLVGEAIRHRLGELCKTRRAGMAILDVAKLLESGIAELCDTLILVSAPRRQRLARAAARGWGATELAARERFQVSLRAKRAAADFVLENGGTRDSLEAHVRRIWDALLPTGGTGRTGRRAAAPGTAKGPRPRATPAPAAGRRAARRAPRRP